MKTNPLRYLLDDEDVANTGGGYDQTPPEPIHDEPEPVEPVADSDADDSVGPTTPQIPNPAPDMPGGLSKPTNSPEARVAPTEQTDPRAALESKLIQESLIGPNATAASSTQTNPQLASTAPSWYKSIAPPRQKSSLPGDILKTVLGSLLAPSRREKRLATMQGLGGMIDNLQNKEQSQFNTDLDAATKQAQMYRTLNPVSRTSGSGRDQTLGALNYLLGKDRFGRAVENDKAKAAQAAAEADPRSKESMAAKQALVASGAATFDQVKDLSAHDIKTQAARFGQSAQRDWSGSEADRRMQNREAIHMGQEERAQTYALSKEARNQEQQDLQAYQPNYDFVTGHAPPLEKQKQFTELTSNRDMLVNNAQKLKEIQDKYSQIASTGIGKLDQWIGSPEEKELLSQAKLAHFNIFNALRSKEMANLGVLQLYEKPLVDAVNPEAGSLTEMFQGPFAWDALMADADQRVNTNAPKYGYVPKGTKPETAGLATDKPAEQALPQFQKPTRQPYKSRSQPQGEFVPKPAPVTAPTLNLKGEVTVKLKSPSGVVKDVAVTQEMLDHFIQKGFTVVQ